MIMFNEPERPNTEKTLKEMLKQGSPELMQMLASANPDLMNKMLPILRKNCQFLNDKNLECSCGNRWSLHPNTNEIEVAVKLVYDSQENCMRDIYDLRCTNCKQTYQYLGEPYPWDQDVVKAFKDELSNNSFGRFLVIFELKLC